MNVQQKCIIKKTYKNRRSTDFCNFYCFSGIMDPDISCPSLSKRDKADPVAIKKCVARCMYKDKNIFPELQIIRYFSQN